MPTPQEVFRVEGVELMFAEIKESLHDFGVDFDVYFHENALHESGRVDKALGAADASRATSTRPTAPTWLRTTDFGDDKDRVLRQDRRRAGLLRRRPAPTTSTSGSAASTACMIMLGADHHGYVGRLKAMAACFGDDPDADLEVLIGQLVNLVKDGQPVRMSKRAGTVITLEDLVDAVGVDAARYALARYSSDSPIDIDLDLLDPGQPTTTRSTTSSTPTPAPPASRRNAAEVGLTRASRRVPPGAARPREGERAAHGARASSRGVVATAAELRAPHRVARYLEELSRRRSTAATTTAGCRPKGDEEITDAHRARLWLNDATRVVIANGLAPARRLRPGADVAPMRSARGRLGPARRRSAAGGPPGCAPRSTSTPWCRSSGRGTCTRAAGDGALEVGGLAVRDAGRRVRHPGVRAGRGRPARALPGTFRAAFPDADVYYAGKAFLCTRGGPHGSPRRAWASTSAPAASWPSRWRPGCRPSGSASTATTSRWPS